MSKVLIIAEAGVNHNGDIAIAKKLIDAANDAGADFVKFQTFKADKLASKNAVKAEYQMQNTGKEETQWEMLKKLELTSLMHNELIDYCKNKSIQFLSTPFDEESAIYLSGLGLKIGKIPSGEVTNFRYLQTMAKSFSNIIMSTGMCTMQEILEALTVLLNSGLERNKITLLHCNTEYPTPMKDVNLLAMKQIEDETGCKVGYSDHTQGIEVSIAAVALGAVVIEKHFTLDCSMEGPDHKASLEPLELKRMVSAIKNIENAISGDGVKLPSTSEKKNIIIARKSLVAVEKISKGSIILEHMLIAKRPGNGISPMQIEKVIGTIAVKDFEIDELICI